jgi:leucyl-tRNA synthetase
MEHVTRHMIYSRFWHRFLYDNGLVNTPEPYAKRTYQGLILGPDGDKMSKTKGNVVDPIDIVNEYGADTLRLYVLFMGDYTAATPWSENAVKGCRRFLHRFASLTDIIDAKPMDEKIERSVHKTIKKVTEDIEAMKFNTAIAAMMSLINEISDAGTISREQLSAFIRILTPFCPHICEEMWAEIGEEGMASTAPWPDYDEAKTVDDTVEIVVQINGKVRSKMMISIGEDKEKIIADAKQVERIPELLEGKQIMKEIYVPGKLVNLVVR